MTIGGCASWKCTGSLAVLREVAAAHEAAVEAPLRRTRVVFRSQAPFAAIVGAGLCLPDRPCARIAALRVDGGCAQPGLGLAQGDVRDSAVDERHSRADNGRRQHPRPRRGRGRRAGSPGAYHPLFVRRPPGLRHYSPLPGFVAFLSGRVVRCASMSHPALFALAWYALSMNSSRVSLREALLRTSSYVRSAVPPSGSQLAAPGLSRCSVKPSDSGAV